MMCVDLVLVQIGRAEKTKRKLTKERTGAERLRPSVALL